MLPRVFSSRPPRSLPRARSSDAGLPRLALIMCSTLSQSQDQAPSCAVFQSLGTSDRRDASITARYSVRLMAPLVLARRKPRTSHSSCSRPQLETLRTMASKETRTSFIQSRSPKPMTAALKVNISLKVVGTVAALRLAASLSSVPESSLPMPFVFLFDTLSFPPRSRWPMLLFFFPPSWSPIFSAPSPSFTSSVSRAVSPFSSSFVLVAVAQLEFRIFRRSVNFMRM
mmetsp:Transcript_122586/g.381624  ORF Transcript_122586/g.381624 Transcript_122586/m.381624 type:complete len:228 (-) Transcript_122586:89-772(-)